VNHGSVRGGSCFHTFYTYAPGGPSGGSYGLDSVLGGIYKGEPARPRRTLTRLTNDRAADPPMVHTAACPLPSTLPTPGQDGGLNASILYEFDRPESFGLKRGWRLVTTVGGAPQSCR
jgi:hypothetical protein